MNALSSPLWSKMAPVSEPAPSPSCCAGVVQTVLNGWRDRFPLDSSPFYSMSVSSGATRKELLAACARLHHSGALQPIRARWGPGLPRRRWRMGFETAPSQQESLASALVALPGCVRVERGSEPTGQCSVWAEVEALDAGALERQLAVLTLPPTYRRLLHSTQGAPSGPCDDPMLASLVERGLPLCARPYLRCAQRLNRPERQVLAALRTWQRDGHLECLTLAPTPTRSSSDGLLALWRDFDPDERMRSLLPSIRGMEQVLEFAPGGADWPWRFGLLVMAPETLAMQRLAQWNAAAGNTILPDRCVTLRVAVPRDAALLFGI